MNKREEILAEAQRCVCGNREDDYGTPEDNFRCIAELWTAYVKKALLPANVLFEICPEDVAAMMILLKIARITNGQAKPDNWIDIAGYAACGGEIECSRLEIHAND